MNKIIDYLESNLVDPQIRRSNNDFIYKTVQLDESTALSFTYQKDRFKNARIAIKNEGAESINIDSTTWLNDPSISTILYFRNDSIEFYPYDYENNTRSCMAYGGLSGDDNIDIFEDDGTNQFKQTSTTSVSTILEALQQRDYAKIITGNVKTTGKQI